MRVVKYVTAASVLGYVSRAAAYFVIRVPYHITT